MKPVRPPRRSLRLRDVAELMKVEHPDPHYRVKFVRRLLQRLEKRDGTAYLRRAGPRSPWYVSPEGLEALDPYNPAALGKLRDDVSEIQEGQRGIRQQLGAHGSRIRRLEEFKRKTAEYLASVADL